MRDVCVRTELCTRCSCWDRIANVLMLRVQNCGCAAWTGIGAANAYTKRDIENPFSGTQMFVQTSNKNVFNTYFEQSTFLNSSEFIVFFKEKKSTFHTCTPATTCVVLSFKRVVHPN